MFGDAELDVFYDAFGVEATHRPAAGGPPTTVLVIHDEPGNQILGGEVFMTEPSLRYRTSTLPRAEKGDRFTLGRTEYIAREAAQNLKDGLEHLVPLAKV